MGTFPARVRDAALLVAVTLLVAAGCAPDAPDHRPPSPTGAPSHHPVTLEVRPVLEVEPVTPNGPAPPGGLVLQDGEQGPYLVLGPVALDASDVRGADASQPVGSLSWAVTVLLAPRGARAFGALTAAAACAQGPRRRIAFVVDGEVLSSPEVELPCGSAITSAPRLTGNFTEERARELAAGLHAQE